MSLKTRSFRGRRLSRSELFIGLLFLALIVSMTVLAIFLNLWWLKQEEEEPSERTAMPASTNCLIATSPHQDIAASAQPPAGVK
jgi:hypothetical protein